MLLDRIITFGTFALSFLRRISDCCGSRLPGYWMLWELSEFNVLGRRIYIFIKFLAIAGISFREI